MYCNICKTNRNFKTQQALQRHNDAKHPAPARRPNTRNVQPRRRRQAPTTERIGPMLPMQPRATNRSFFLAPTNTGKSTRTFLPSKIPLNLGSTFEGSTWARRILHPNDETVGGGVPIPDLSESQSANFELRHGIILSNPTGSTTENWDIEFAVLPFPDVALAYRYKVVSSSDWSFWQLLTALQNEADPGIATIEQTLDTPFSVSSTPRLGKSSTAARQSFRGLTVELNANAFRDQGIMTAGQWGAKTDRIPMKPSKLESNVSVAPIVDHFIVDSIPTTPDAIIRACPEAGQWNARDGVYLPLRPVDPTHIYQSTHPAVYGVGGSNDDETGSPVVLKDDNTGDEFNYARSLIYVTQDGLPIYTSAAVINQNLGVVIFSGLDPSANLMVRLRSGLEVVPSVNSSLAVFTQNCVTLDDQALKAVQIMSSRLPVCYAAKYNSLGLMLPLIAQLAPTVLSMIGGLLGRRSQPKTQAKRMPAQMIEEGPD